MSDAIRTALLSFSVAAGGAMVSTLLAYYFGRRLEDEKAARATRIEAYVAYLTALAESAAAKTLKNQQALELAMTRLIAAKMRVGLHGSERVIDAIISAEKASLQRHTNLAFEDVYARMREESPHLREAIPPRLGELLNGR